jgi:hypothetical protein
MAGTISVPTFDRKRESLWIRLFFGEKPAAHAAL